MNDLWLSFITDLSHKNFSPFLIPLLKKMRLIDSSHNIITLSCENRGMIIFLETKKKELEEKFSQHIGKKITISFVIKEKKRVDTIETPLLDFHKKTALSLEESIGKAGLQPRFTFENFAVSSTNQIAYTAAQAVAEKIGVSYNPLFIYGGVGVGKTHLTHAIGITILKKDPSKKIRYCTSEEFTNDLIELIRAKNTSNFRKKYRFLSVLFIDDIQFVAGKNYIQEELYHTFNTIIKHGGQIVLTSDKPPKEISRLEDRLRSRFSGGLIIDIQKPDVELRTAILLIKAQERNIELDIEAAKLIAEQVDDARELEGKLLSTYAHLAKNNEKITTEIVRGEIIQKNKKLIAKKTPHEIIKIICSYYDIRASHIRGSSRQEKIAFPRQIIMYILRTLFKTKFEDIAFILKRKDHTTIIHGVNKITQLSLKNPIFKEEIDRIINSITSST
ncbi:MAG TPA: chromosomal replication initiator protein DnaA [Patescibacteria group bacterium]|nr:chromosomal replication initiator protein DnaA [Patescibacteria group bacterium]